MSFDLLMFECDVYGVILGNDDDSRYRKLKPHGCSEGSLLWALLIDGTIVKDVEAERLRDPWPFYLLPNSLLPRGRNRSCHEDRR